VSIASAAPQPPADVSPGHAGCRVRCHRKCHVSSCQPCISRQEQRKLLTESQNWAEIRENPRICTNSLIARKFVSYPHSPVSAVGCRLWPRERVVISLEMTLDATIRASVHRIGARRYTVSQPIEFCDSPPELYAASPSRSGTGTRPRTWDTTEPRVRRRTHAGRPSGGERPLPGRAWSAE
jgi:hypothetical protein